MTVIHLPTWRQESILDFVIRQGPVTTYAVANRFGLKMNDALNQLHALRRQGLVVGQIESLDYCAMYSWWATEEGKKVKS